MAKMIPEPYKIKMVEPIQLIPKAEREQRMKEAGYNPFLLQSKDVYLDLLTDSGTGAMSDRQWAALMMGDESYAGSRSFSRLEKTVKSLTGYQYVLPAHQGRGAEQVLFPLLLERKGLHVLGNMHFDTTKAHIELNDAIAKNFVIEDAYETEREHPFKGNMDLDALSEHISLHRRDVAFIVHTITCNSAGGQPVSMKNMRAVYQLASAHQIPVVLDAARFAENAYFIKEREAEYANKTIANIVKEMFSYGDAFTMSAKKDGLVNIGGLIGIKENGQLYEKCRAMIVPLEGFPTYGGLAGRDMEALASGLEEVIDEAYLQHRLNQVNLLGQLLLDGGVPIQSPVGGHAVFVDAAKFLPHLKKTQFPGHALAIALYVESGIRAVEIGSLLYGRDPLTKKDGLSRMELLRLTIPRRVYTDNHIRYIAEALIDLYQKRDKIAGVNFVYEPEVLRHFTAKFEVDNQLTKV